MSVRSIENQLFPEQPQATHPQVIGALAARDEVLRELEQDDNTPQPETLAIAQPEMAETSFQLSPARPLNERMLTPSVNMINNDFKAMIGSTQDRESQREAIREQSVFKLLRFTGMLPLRDTTVVNSAHRLPALSERQAQANLVANSRDRHAFHTWYTMATEKFSAPENREQLMELMDTYQEHPVLQLLEALRVLPNSYVKAEDNVFMLRAALFILAEHNPGNAVQ